MKKMNNDICLECGKRLIKYRLVLLCNACYTRIRRQNLGLYKPKLSYKKFKEQLDEKIKILKYQRK